MIKLYEIFQDKQQFYLVEDFVNGGELFNTVVRHKAIHERDIIRITKDLLSALAYCHERGIVHRNLKPEHILMEAIA